MPESTVWPRMEGKHAHLLLSFSHLHFLVMMTFSHWLPHPFASPVATQLSSPYILLLHLSLPYLWNFVGPYVHQAIGLQHPLQSQWLVTRHPIFSFKRRYSNIVLKQYCLSHLHSRFDGKMTPP